MKSALPLLSRIYDVKHRFARDHNIEATQLFIGPKENKELEACMKKLAREKVSAKKAGRRVSTKHGIESETLAGLSIVRLLGDGLMAGAIVQ